jgi:hypothetical protein
LSPPAASRDSWRRDRERRPPAERSCGCRLHVRRDRCGCRTTTSTGDRSLRVRPESFDSTEYRGRGAEGGRHWRIAADSRSIRGKMKLLISTMRQSSFSLPRAVFVPRSHTFSLSLPSSPRTVQREANRSTPKMAICLGEGFIFLRNINFPLARKVFRQSPAERMTIWG